MTGKDFIATQGAVLSLGKQLEHLDFEGFMEYLEKIDNVTPVVVGNESSLRGRTSLTQMKRLVIGLSEAQKAFRDLRIVMAAGVTKHDAKV